MLNLQNGSTGDSVPIKKPDNIKDVKIARGWTREPKGRKRILSQYITVNKEKIRLDVYVYECVHGKLPHGYSVIHLDNDLNNNNIDNLRAAPKEIRRLFSGAGYSKMPQVLAPALYAQVMLRHAIKRLSIKTGKVAKSSAERKAAPREVKGE